MKLKWFVRERAWARGGVIYSGWGNGYVVLPKTHPYYGKEEIPVDVHGGLTFTEYGIDYFLEGTPWPEMRDCDASAGWIVGFDTMHYGDTLSTWPRERVIKETLRLKEQLEKLW